jgi:3-polyprenyl-4-hydroxybenzoate decarboxylase
MSITNSPSDYTAINVDYATGSGFYTDKSAVANLLQVPAFTSSTYPSESQVGEIIKRVEGMIDEKVKRSYRPLLHKNEHYNFEFVNHPMQTYYGGYVGFIQLTTLKLRKVVSLRVWQGNRYIELASAQAQIKLLENYRDIYSIVLQLPNGGTEFEMLSESAIGGSLSNSEFNNAYGIKTTNDEIVALINEQFPSKTSTFTKATAAKSLISSSLSISDLFYAQKDSEDSTNLLISSLLAGEDGSECKVKIRTQQAITHTNGSTNLVVADSSKLVVGMEIEDNNNHIPSGTTITAIVDSTNITMSAAATNTGSGTGTFTAIDTSVPTLATITKFTDKQDLKRLGSFWTIKDEARIFFLRDYPYHTQNSVIISYIAGDSRVPSTIHEAATKLTAAEILRHDDQTILVAETGANISTKEKYDILRKEAMDILSGKGDIVFLVE